jgi:hypothetical protein
MLRFINVMLSVIVTNIIMLSVVMLNVMMLRVVVPTNYSFLKLIQGRLVERENLVPMTSSLR